MKKYIAALMCITLALSLLAGCKYEEEDYSDRNRKKHTDSDSYSDSENDSDYRTNINDGDGVYTVPNLVGNDYNEVVNNTQLQDQFSIEFNWEFNSEYEYGCIYQQSVVPGKELNQGAKITVYVSMGVATKAVPNVKNMTQVDAKMQLEVLGFKVIIEEIHSETMQMGLVVSTSPSAGTQVKENSTVTIYVSCGK